MKKRNFIINLLIISLSFLAFNACIDDVNYDIEVNKKETIGEYLANNPDYYGRFYDVLKRTSMLGLLNSYGRYTCFIPTNSAVDKFIEESGYGSIDDYPIDILKQTVLYQLIENDTIRTIDFVGSRLRTNNMMGDNLQIRTNEKGDYVLNGVATILYKDKSLKNGIVHTTNAILTPDKNNVFRKLESDEYEGRFSIFYQALYETEIYKLLEVSEDPTEFSYIREKDNVKVNIARKYRFTLLAESNQTYKDAGINSFEDLKEKYDDGNGAITDTENGLYKFVAYHCLKAIYDESNFIWYSKQDGYEIVEPISGNLLLEFRKIPEGVVFNHFLDDAGNVLKQGVMMTSDVEYKNILCNNGMIHEVKSILEIPDQKTYFSKKMRFNVCSFLPELMNIGARGNGGTELQRKEFPDASLGGPQFFENMTIIGDGGRVIPLYDYTPSWIRHQFDEILIGLGYETLEQCDDLNQWANTRYDVTLKLPPIPSGVWEVRFGFSAAARRGMTQLYFDGKPSGIPFRMDYNVDYGIDGMDEETARKILYYNSFMPFPSNIKNGNGQSAGVSSKSDRMRKVLGTYSFSKMEHHTLRFKTVEPGQLSLNFVEFIPVDQIPNEGTN